MTTLVLQSAGAVLADVAGAAVGALGSLASAALAGGGAAAKSSARVVEGPRLSEMSGLGATEGAPIPRLYGRARLGGQLIWATRFEETANTVVERSSTRSGGKGGGSSKKAKTTTTTTTTTTYSYAGNVAIGLCEGPIAFVRRVWADGRELDLTTTTMRVHRGDAEQMPDPLIVAKEGAENAPAYRGLAYVVFEHLALGDFGNRVPQFSFEVVRVVPGLPGMVRALCLIPGATEFGYDPLPVSRVLGLGASAPENRHQLQSATDVTASLDALQALCPSVRRVSLVASWFGDDLRAGSCRITPRVERSLKDTYGDIWSAGGLARATALPVSEVAGRPAYGGTPSDAGLIRAIQTLKARGLEVVLYPFVMMDIPAGNVLPDPRTGEAGQPPYPWRGRITCDPAPGMAGSVDGTAAAADQVAAFLGNAVPAHFTVAGGRVLYAGPAEWSLRRLVLHYAHLALAAGGVDAFVIGSELVGLTRVRGADGGYPAVAALRALAADVRAVLGPGVKLTYGADWTEYGADVREDGAEIRFPLDALWADPAIDAVGIDFYPPLQDWRDGADHADLAQARSATDRNAPRDGLGSGPDFDWFYAGEADRLAQIRTPITDGAYGKPWIFRAKDLVGWWSNPHVERSGGLETGATAWLPAGKPVWLTETGIPAVDKGANGPNVFPDPKSAESALPPFSSGGRDDLVQVRGLEAILSRFDPALPGFAEAGNPVSPVYGGRMVDPANVFAWAWDARPFPAFPDFDQVWADGANWQTGHWLTGRLEGVALDRLVAAVLADYGLEPAVAIALDGFLDGYVVDRPMSAREALEPLLRLFGVEAVAGGGGLRFMGRGGPVAAALARDDLAVDQDGPALTTTRAQETDLPHQIEIGFTDGEGEYGRAAVASRRLAGSSRREQRSDLAVVTRRAEAQRLADQVLQDLWAERETAEFALAPAMIGLDPGDIVSLPAGATDVLHRVVRIADGPLRRVSSRAVEPAATVAASPAAPGGRRSPPRLPGRPKAVVLDLAVARGEPTVLRYIAVAADPWPGAMAIWRSADGGSFALHRVVDLPAIVGRTETALEAGPLWRWDRASSLDVTLSQEGPSSASDLAVLEGANLFALRGIDGSWEMVAAAGIELIGPGRYRLSRLLRGLGGSEDKAARIVPAGATIVRLDDGVVPLTDALADLGRTWLYRIGPADRDHADPAVIEITTTARPDALRPFAPVRIGARREAEGVRLSWIRRTRRDGDAWEPIEVPLGEDGERYDVDILDGSSVVRTLAAAAPEAVYAAADEVADFGAPQDTLALRVAQVSASVGRGFPGEARVAVR